MFQTEWTGGFCGDWQKHNMCVILVMAKMTMFTSYMIYSNVIISVSYYIYITILHNKITNMVLVDWTDMISPSIPSRSVYLSVSLSVHRSVHLSLTHSVSLSSSVSLSVNLPAYNPQDIHYRPLPPLSLPFSVSLFNLI